MLCISCMIMTLPAVLVKQGADEIFGLVCDLLKALFIKLPLGGCDQGQGLCIAVTLEWRLATQSDDHRQSSVIILTVSVCIH